LTIIGMTIKAARKAVEKRVLSFISFLIDACGENCRAALLYQVTNDSVLQISR